MEIVKNNPQYKILTPESELKAQFFRIEEAGRTCYQSIKNEITFETAQKFIKMLLKLGHESVIEHSLLTVKFSNVSRGFTHEIVRHRLCSFSQESTRYVDLSGSIKFIVPPHLDENKKIALENGKAMSLAEMLQEEEMFYRALRKADFLPEDARQVLPIATKAEIVVSANFRQWRHIFKLRTALASHWEIRLVLGALLAELQKILPVIFDDFALAGKCPKGVGYFKLIVLT